MSVSAEVVTTPGTSCLRMRQWSGGEEDPIHKGRHVGAAHPRASPTAHRENVVWHSASNQNVMLINGIGVSTSSS
jgi:hypothetical protein